MNHRGIGRIDWDPLNLDLHLAALAFISATILLSDANLARDLDRDAENDRDLLQTPYGIKAQSRHNG